MADINMPLSEFQEMEKNRKLLEESLEREKSLNDKVAVLQQEKIDALANASQKVIKVIRHEHTDSFISPIPVDNELVTEVFHAIRRRNHGTWSDMIDDINRVRKILFKTERTDRVEPAYTTFQGLDEVREEIRKDLEASYGKKLAEADKVLKEFDKLRKEAEDADTRASIHRNSREANLRELKQLQHEHRKVVKSYEKLQEQLKKVRDHANKGFGWRWRAELRRLLKYIS